ncbi:hypothetical protein D3C85_763100 [compost metagenome]
MISGISVQPSTTASQPSSSFRRCITRWKVATASGLKMPQTSSSMMIRPISARSSMVGRTYSSPRAESFSGYTSLSVSQRVPVMPMRRKPRRTASSATTSAMCSQGRGERGATWSKAWWMVLSGQIRKSAPAAASLCAEPSISAPTPARSPASRQRVYSASEGVCIDTSGCACGPSSAAPSMQMVL